MIKIFSTRGLASGFISEPMTLPARDSIKISFEDVTNDYFAVYTQYNQYRTGDVINRNGHAIINIVRFDTIKHVVSGTFQFTLFDEKGLSYVNVEQGRFDITF
jgi:hypothetical protein